MISFTIDMLGWTPNKGTPITGQTGHPRVHLPNRRLGKLEKQPIMHITQTGYPGVQSKIP